MLVACNERSELHRIHRYPVHHGLRLIHPAACQTD